MRHFLRCHDGSALDVAGDRVLTFAPMIERAQSRPVKSRQDQRISGSALSLFIVGTSTGRLYAGSFLVGCCLLGLLSGVTGLSGDVGGAIAGVCSGVFIIVVGRRAARYWASIESPDDQP